MAAKEISSLPKNAGAYQQLVTNADGALTWEDKLVNKTTVLSFDGNVDGRDVVTFEGRTYVKISDLEFAPEDLIGKCIKIENWDKIPNAPFPGVCRITEELVLEDEDSYIGIGTIFSFIYSTVASEVAPTGMIMRPEFPSKGTYALYLDESFTAEIGGFPIYLSELFEASTIPNAYIDVPHINSLIDAKIAAIPNAEEASF